MDRPTGVGGIGMAKGDHMKTKILGLLTVGLLAPDGLMKLSS